MRGAFVGLMTLSVAAGCSSESERPPLFGGFTPTDGAAVEFAPTVCDVSFIGTTSISGIALFLTSEADACAIVTQTQLCGTAASSSTVLGFAINGAPGSAGVSPTGAGTYVFMPDPPTGPFLAATGEAARVDASCQGDSPDMSGGSINLSSVTTDRVAGSMDMQFENGEVFQHPFDVATCPVSLDLCAKITQPCFTYACVP